MSTDLELLQDSFRDNQADFIITTRNLATD